MRVPCGHLSSPGLGDFTGSGISQVAGVGTSLGSCAFRDAWPHAKCYGFLKGTWEGRKLGNGGPCGEDLEVDLQDESTTAGSQPRPGCGLRCLRPAVWWSSRAGGDNWCPQQPYSGSAGAREEAGWRRGKVPGYPELGR